MCRRFDSCRGHHRSTCGFPPGEPLLGNASGKLIPIPCETDYANCPCDLLKGAGTVPQQLRHAKEKVTDLELDLEGRDEPGGTRLRTIRRCRSEARWETVIPASLLWRPIVSAIQHGCERRAASLSSGCSIPTRTVRNGRTCLLPSGNEPRSCGSEPHALRSLLR